MLCRNEESLMMKKKLAYKGFLIWPNGLVFVYELSGSGFESSCSYLNFRYRACFKFFDERPYHKQASQLIWIETQLTCFHMYKKSTLNGKNFSNQISLFNVSKNDFFTGLMRYYMSAANFWIIFCFGMKQLYHSMRWCS